MLEGVDADKERLNSLRTEYAALFTHFHFFQVLRFGVLAATLPFVGVLFSYYRTALPFSQIRLLLKGEIVKIDPDTAVIVALVSLGIFVAVRSIEKGIGLHTRAIVNRGSIIETALSIDSGVFTALYKRVTTVHPSKRISGIVGAGYLVGGIFSIVLVAIGIWAMYKNAGG
jgi:hypothetical protein